MTQDHEEFEGEAELRALFEEDRRLQNPGDHFFASMEEEIMGSLEPRGELLRGGEVSGVAPVASGGGFLGWWGRFWALGSSRPTLVYAVMMAVALVLLVVWPSEEVSRPDEPARVANVEKSLVPHDLTGEELVRLRALTEELEIDVLAEEGGWATLDEESQVGLEEAFEEFSQDDLEWWDVQLDERTL